jgi:uncharacterized membrane protein YczE
MKQAFKQNIPNVMAYAVGILIAAFGVSLMKKSGLGLGPLGVAAEELQMLMVKIIPFFTFGMASAVHTYLMFFVILLVNKNFKSVFIVLSIFLINASVDLFDLIILKSLVINGSISDAILGHSIGFLSYSFGTTWIILSKLPGLVIEEFTFSMMKLTKSKNYILMRIIVSYGAFILAIGYSFFTLSGLASVTVLSFVQGFAFGPVIGWMVKLTKKYNLHVRLKLLRSAPSTN